MLRKQEVFDREKPLINEFLTFRGDVMTSLKFRIPLEEAAVQFAEADSGGKIKQLSQQSSTLQKKERERGFFSSIFDATEAQANKDKAWKLFQEQIRLQEEIKQNYKLEAAQAFSYLYGVLGILPPNIAKVAAGRAVRGLQVTLSPAATRD